MLRLLAELYERGSGRLFHSSDRAAPAERVVGSVHEVEAVRSRCVEGAVKSNLGTLRARAARELRRATYAGLGLAEGQPAWLQAVQTDLRVFVEALLLCTQSRKLSKASLLEVRISFETQTLSEGAHTCKCIRTATASWSARQSACFARVHDLGKVHVPVAAVHLTRRGQPHYCQP